MADGTVDWRRCIPSLPLAVAWLGISAVEAHYGWWWAIAIEWIFVLRLPTTLLTWATRLDRDV